MMSMGLVDTHCHLQDPAFDNDREAVIARAVDALDWLVVIGDDLENSRRALVLSRERIYATAGFHPYHADHVDESALAAIRRLAAQPCVIAIGEIGLDYFNEFSPRAAQRRALEMQLDLAQSLCLPAVIHCRDAEDDMLAILRDHAASLPSVIMHCFGGDGLFAKQCLDLGCFISFAGNVTFPKAHALRDAAAATPPDRMLLETDAPYLAPQPRRGRRCEPADVLHTARFLADFKKMEYEVFCTQTVENAHRAFGVARTENG
ncbi:MAG TPA: TatD family deoxyribonuclease [Candidatus Hydrogenedentes bacterium]|nr:TatD family deoxyribonuclease [Candidatus Hydrogenedentota bacterium]